MKRDFTPDILIINQLRRLSGYLIGAIVTIALLVLTGWQWDITLLQRPIPGPTAMNPLTALTFLLCSSSYLLLVPPAGLTGQARKISARPRQRVIGGVLLAVIVLCIALARIGNSLLPAGWDIDHLLYRDRLLANPPGNIPSRMEIDTAFYFILSSLSLLLLLITPAHPNPEETPARPVPRRPPSFRNPLFAD